MLWVAMQRGLAERKELLTQQLQHIQALRQEKQEEARRLDRLSFHRQQLLLREKAVKAAAISAGGGGGDVGRTGSPVTPPPSTPPQLATGSSRRVWEVEGGSSAPRDLGISPGAMRSSQQLRLEAAREELDMSLRELDEVTTALEQAKAVLMERQQVLAQAKAKLATLGTMTQELVEMAQTVEAPST